MKTSSPLVPRSVAAPRIELLESRIAPAAIVNISVNDDILTEVAHGSQITYTVKFSNTGDADADVTLTEAPGNYLSGGFNPGWDLDFSSNTYTYHYGNLVAGSGEQSLTFIAFSDDYIPTSVSSLKNVVSIVTNTQEGEAASQASNSVDTLVYQGIRVTSPGVSRPGHYDLSVIKVHDITLNTDFSFTAYGTLRDSIRTSTADFNRDGFDDIIVLSEHGKGPVEVFDGTNGHQLETAISGLLPFGSKTGGFLATYGPFFIPDSESSSLLVVFGSSLGGGAVKVFDGLSGDQTGSTLYPFGKTYTGGVRVAAGDVNGDGLPEAIAAQGNFGNKVNVYNAYSSSLPLIGTFSAFASNFRGGLNVAAGDMNGDGLAEVVVGKNQGSPSVEIWSPHNMLTFKTAITSNTTFTKIGGFNAFASNYLQGVRVALVDSDLDGHLDILVAVGWAGKSQVKIFDGGAYGNQLPPTYIPELLSSFTAYPEALEPGVWIAGSTLVPGNSYSIFR